MSGKTPQEVLSTFSSVVGTSDNATFVKVGSEALLAFQKNGGIQIMIIMGGVLLLYVFLKTQRAVALETLHTKVKLKNIDDKELARQHLERMCDKVRDGKEPSPHVTQLIGQITDMKPDKTFELDAEAVAACLKQV